MQEARLTWLQSLAVWPPPGWSKYMTFAEKVSRMGSTGAASSSVAPTMSVRVPSSAPFWPPVTGQSKACLSSTSAASWMSRASCGELVVRSMSQAPRLATRMSPSVDR